MPVSDKARVLFDRLVQRHMAWYAEEAMRAGEELDRGIVQDDHLLNTTQMNGLAGLAATTPNPRAVREFITHQGDKGRKRTRGANPWDVRAGDGDNDAMCRALNARIAGMAVQAQNLVTEVRNDPALSGEDAELQGAVQTLCDDRDLKLEIEMRLVRHFVSSFCTYYSSRIPIGAHDNEG